jgi:DNA-binding ferritin-like protein (Dps family)
MTTTIDVDAVAIPSILEEISGEERGRLTELEERIDRGFKAFYESGKALTTIRDERLYREHYGTFEAYCEDRWGITPRHARRLIDAATVVEILGPFGPKIPQGFILPSNESQCRPLTELSPENQIHVWTEVVKEEKITAAVIEEIAEAEKLKSDREYRYKKAQEISLAAVADNAEIPKTNGADAIFEHWEAKKKKPLSERQKAVLREDVEEFARDAIEDKKETTAVKPEAESDSEDDEPVTPVQKDEVTYAPSGKAHNPLSQKELKEIVRFFQEDYSPKDLAQVIKVLPEEYKNAIREALS